MPSRAAFCSATYGMRATSAFTKTMAVILGATSPDRLVLRSQGPPVLERDQALA